jgi:hypothetical protein
MLVLLVLALTTFFYRDKNCHLDGDRRRWLVATFLCLLFLHPQFAKIGWLYRYEAYLVAVGLVITLPTLSQLLRTLLASLMPVTLQRMPLVIPVLGLLVLGFPLAERGFLACKFTKMAMHDRYLEHIQPARFLHEYYPTSTVVVNDIGAVAYFTDCRLLDMYGLGNMEPVRYRRNKSGYTKEQVSEWTTAEDAEIAVLQVQWREVSSRIPNSWVKVAEWEMPRNVIFGDTRIGFFAVKADMADALASHILAFRSKLPKDLQVNMMIDSSNKPDAGDGI